MRVSIGRSELRGSVRAPSSKSYTIRALMCAALANGVSELVFPLLADDTEAASGVLDRIGVKIEQGEAWLVHGGDLRAASGDLDCRESAATLRFMTAVAGVVPGESRLVAKPSLVRRPITPLIDALNQLGVECHQDATAGYVLVKGSRLNGGTTTLPGNISSQYVTALLLIAPLANNRVTIRLTTALESRPYVEMTVECLERFGVKVNHSDDYREFQVDPQRYQPARYEVEGDWSSVSYWAALGALAGEIEVTNVHRASLQGDKVFVDFMAKMGAKPRWDGNRVTLSNTALSGLTVDLTDCIDLLPTIAVAAALAQGKTELTGVSRARLKESDRVGSVREELEKAGVKVIEEENKLTVFGGSVRGATFQSHGDHRMAMALSVLGVVCGDTVIEGAECVSKTYPEYWDVLKGLGGKVTADV